MARKWQQVAAGEWHCEPWRICRMFLDGCTLFVLFRMGDPGDEAFAHCESREDAMAEARRLEALA